MKETPKETTIRLLRELDGKPLTSDVLAKERGCLVKMAASQIRRIPQWTGGVVYRSKFGGLMYGFESEAALIAYGVLSDGRPGRPRPTEASHLADLSSGTAWRVAPAAKLDAWSRVTLEAGGPPLRRTYPPLYRRPVWMAPTRAAPVEGPDLLIQKAGDRALAIELEYFDRLCAEAVSRDAAIKAAADALASVDVAAALARRGFAKKKEKEMAVQKNVKVFYNSYLHILHWPGQPSCY